MLIDKKDVFIERSNWWLEDPGQPIDLGKIRAPVSGGFYQASCGIEGFLEKGGVKIGRRKYSWGICTLKCNLLSSYLKDALWSHKKLGH